jgi:phosphoribosyl 1,2-cyclic phosphodiesterase
MSLYITSLNSGSNGNCYYIGNEREAVLIDAGISCRETEHRMSRLGLSIRNIRAIFITHRPSFMSLLVLSHLSAQNNSPQIVHDLFSKHANGTRIVVASRYEESEVYCVRD